ncbi:MAG: hypothetical protein CMG46_02915 [Candidatus Marinimicrobia bacterium]|nr:hypothetical protein [Candidatus Neomarinimicrobiota bacterium]
MEETVEKRLERLEEKIDQILDLLQKEVRPNCKKMGDHIDFVENVYDNVKNPLGFICNKVNYFRAQDDNVKYTLENN